MLVEPLPHIISQMTPLFAVGLALTGVVAAFIIPYYMDPHNMRKYPGPFLAKFSDIWLAYVIKGGHRSEVIHKLHLKYGTHVRIAPNHLSISDPNALQTIYAFGNGALKSDLYDSLVSVRPSVFSTRDRAEHTRKRKIISHMFSAKRVAEFEPTIRGHLITLTNQWDRMCTAAKTGTSGIEGGGWHGASGRLWLDVLSWMNYLAFDITGDLLFSVPFGMVEAGNDVVPVSTSVRVGVPDKFQHGNVSAVNSRTNRGKSLIGTAILPRWVRPIALKLLSFSHHKGAGSFTGIASAAVSKRLDSPAEYPDLLGKLRAGKDGKGQPMSREEIIAEIIGQLVAGSTTVANTCCGVFYFLASHPSIQSKLQEELDEQLGVENETASTLEQVKRLSYLEKVINEAMRLHPAASLGLPRVLPEGGLDIMGDHFPAGAVVSVPSYTIHRDKHVWGEDVEVFRPERWDEQESELMRKTFNPYSYGPRACVGRNLAQLELQIIISSLVRRYHFVLEKEDQLLETSEEFLRKAVSCRLGIKHRSVG